MTVHIYQGGLRTVAKSGVGQAALHQRAMLQSAGVRVTDDRAEPADLIHINTVLPDSLLAALRARRRGQRVVWYAHSTPQDFRDSFVGSNALAPLFGLWLRLCYGRADLLLTPTPYARGLVRRLCPGKPLLALSNGVDTAFFAPSREHGAAFRARYHLAPGEPVVVSAGHFMVRKGILDYIALARALPAVRFFWFGHTPPALVPAKVRRAMAAAPANLCFAGFVSQGELRDACCGADAFVFCSREETEGIAVLEALACGTPVLLRDIPVYDGWLRAGHEVRKARDLADFAWQTEELLGDPGSAAALGAAGRQAALARSLPRLGRALRRVEERLCAKTNPVPMDARRRSRIR